MDRELSNLVAEFDRAVEAWCGDPDRTVDATYTTRLLVEQGEWEALVAEWRAASDDPVAARRLAWALTDQGDRPGARRALDRAAELDDLPVLAARAARGGLRSRAARARYERARDRRLRADEQAAAQGDPHAAYRLAVALAPEAREAEQRWREYTGPLGTPEADAVLSRSRKLTDARADLLARAEQGGSPEALLDVCRGYYERRSRIGDDWEPVPSVSELAREALPWFTRADELGLAEGALYLGWALRQSRKAKHLDRAEAALRRALERGHPRAPHALATLLSGRRPPDWVGAEQVYRQAVERGLAEYAGLAECLEHLGDSEAAERAWRQAAEHSPFSADWLDRERQAAQRSAARYRSRGLAGGQDAPG